MPKKIIYKKKKVLLKYLPKSLSKRDRERQFKSINSKTIKPRPYSSSYPKRRSSWTIKFYKKYGASADLTYISKYILKKKGIDLVMSKGRGAYKSSGSRPNQTAESWARGRLYSVILGGPARRIDQKIWDKYKIKGGEKSKFNRVVFKKGSYPHKLHAIFMMNDKKVKILKFGHQDYTDFTIHKDKERKNRYLMRHRKREQWNVPDTKGSLSKHILWGKTTSLKKNIQLFKKKFKLF